MAPSVSGVAWHRRQWPMGTPIRDTDKASPSTAHDRYDVIGTRVTALAFDEAVAGLVRAPAEGRRIRVHFCTTHTLVEADRDPALRSALNAPEAIAAPDGMPLVWVGRLLGRAVERVCGPDLMPALLDRSRATGGRHYFYGGAPGIAEALVERMAARYPGLLAAGAHSPPFRPLTDAEDAEEVDRLNASRPDYIWVGLGSPKQDRWMADHRDRLDAAVLLGVGAAFDFYGGTLRRAPRWMQRTGLEWVYRLISEPRRLAARYTVVNATFGLLLVRQLLGRRLRRR